MKKTLNVTLAFSLVATSGICIAQIAPSSGAYTTDLTNTYVQDQALDSISTVNMIMCFLGALRPEQKAGVGPYRALVDLKKCDSAKGGSESTSVGSNSEVNYVETVVESSRESTNSPLLSKAWVNMKGQQDQQVYTYTSMSAGSSTTNPNGVFTMGFSGYPVLSPTIKSMQGLLESLGNTVTFYETGMTHGNGPSGTYQTKLSLTQSGTDSGSGRASDNSQNSGGSAVDTTFAFNSTHFLRKVGSNTAQCFSRAATDGEYSTWRYGVYKTDGSRLNLSNPGFNVTYTSGSNTYYGYAGFYGVFFPDVALTTIGNSATLSRPGSNNTYTYNSIGGKLTKLTKRTITLDEVKGQPVRAWLPGTSGETKIYWNGTTIEKSETITCNQNGCQGVAATGTITAASMRSANQNIIQGYSETLGGQVILPVPGSGEFAGNNIVTYRERSSVTPSTASSLTLVCVSECLNGKSAMSTALTNNTTPFATVGSQTQNWGPISDGSKKSYVFTNSGMMVIGSDKLNTNNQVDASGFSSSQLSGQYQYGLRSSMLVPESNAIKCNSDGVANTAGVYICPYLFNQLAETYEWETGTKPWNKFSGLTLVGGDAVTFDPPMKLEVTLSTTNSTLTNSSNQIGSKIKMDYNGFGDLQGIPGSCYDPSTNIKEPCNGSNKYAPAFSLKAGAILKGIGDTSYFAKPLDQEVRFGKVNASFCSTLTLPTSATLPSTLGIDPKITIGNAPTPTNSAPAVIHGIVQ